MSEVLCETCGINLNSLSKVSIKTVPAVTPSLLKRDGRELISRHVSRTPLGIAIAVSHSELKCNRILAIRDVVGSLINKLIPGASVDTNNWLYDSDCLSRLVFVCLQGEPVDSFASNKYLETTCIHRKVIPTKR